ncbi:hypothetical protein ACRQ1B_28190 [Rhizobium panacihumi]|uniref:hypothetical protein n=1 Tax=Rhizobium panacihumi TaxID=2008450 RepID=UPI003D79CC2E
MDGSGFDGPALKRNEPASVLQAGDDIEQQVIAGPEVLKDGLDFGIGVRSIEIDDAIHVVTDRGDIRTGIDQRVNKIGYVSGGFQLWQYLGSPVSRILEDIPLSWKALGFGGVFTN